MILLISIFLRIIILKKKGYYGYFMTGRPSMDYDKIKARDLIENYLIYGSDFAEAELKSMVLEGEEIIEALNNIKSEYDEETDVLQEKIERYTNRIKEYHKIIRELRQPENQKKLINNLESLIKGKEGAFIEKIKGLLKESKQK
jgi:predicted RNase H-like nuclease (RuvC/YqgF family)